MKLLIVDDHGVLREGIKALLQQGVPGTVVLQAGTGAEGLAIAGANRDLDAVLLDLAMPDMDGMEAIVEFARRFPDLPVAVLSASEEPRIVRRALALGARGYIPKSARPRTIVAAVQLVVAGNVYVPPLVLDAEPNAPGNGETAGARNRAPLTQRQIEVLRWLHAGLSNKEIGRKLGLSEKTVKVHVTAIFRSLNVVNRTQAANAARQSDLI